MLEHGLGKQLSQLLLLCFTPNRLPRKLKNFEIFHIVMDALMANMCRLKHHPTVVLNI